MSDETIKEIQWHMDKNDPRPCPFCGGEAYFDNKNDCGCVRCGLEGFDIMSWNERAIEDKYRKALEDIRNEFFKESLHDGATASNMLKIANEALK